MGNVEGIEDEEEEEGEDVEEDDLDEHHQFLPQRDGKNKKFGSPSKKNLPIGQSVKNYREII